MRDDLFAFAQSRGLTNVSKDYCNKLIWGKLSETEAFDKEFPELLPGTNIVMEIE